MKNVWIIVVIILAGIIIGMAAFRGGGGGGDGAQPEARRVPAFALQDYNGNTVRTADFRGKPMVINAWAAWCPFCGKELQDFAVVQKEFGDQVAIIAVDRAETLSAAKQFTDRLGITDELIFLLDPTDSFYALIGGFSMPETIFVDAQGVIREHRRGPIEVDEMRQKIQELINISSQ